MNNNEKNLTENLLRIVGTKEADKNFGEPFIKAFAVTATESYEKILIASYTCSLFLSTFFHKFPSEKLHTFVHYTKQHHTRFSFNCGKYEEIFSHMSPEELLAVSLFDRNGNAIQQECSKQDIFEAFDFYTNT